MLQLRAESHQHKPFDEDYCIAHPSGSILQCKSLQFQHIATHCFGIGD